MYLDTPIEKLTRVGKTTASRLHRLGIKHAKDLLFHFPLRYEDWSESKSISELTLNEDVSIQVEVVSITTRRTRRRGLTMQTALVEDETGSVEIIWFNQPFLTKSLKKGTKVIISGTPVYDRGRMIFKSPKFEISKTEEKQVHTGRILPVYPLSMNLTQKQLQFLVDQALPVAMDLEDPLPEELRSDHGLLELKEAIRFIHYPERKIDIDKAERRFAFEEVFYLQLQSHLLRRENLKMKAPKIEFHEDEVKAFVKTLPFELTGDQKKTAWQILLDLKEPIPMNRLVQGDVGSGKTLVAALSMYNTVLSGFQSALMAPTEVLATQHFNKFKELFTELDLPIALSTGSQRRLLIQGREEKVSRKVMAEAIKDGAVAMVIGTHAVIQKDVHFRRLGLAVIDEQHRFGVEQRKQLKHQSGLKDELPHLLSMTATPIPRSLALVLYGDLSISSIREMPKNRKPIKTSVVKEAKRDEVYQFIRKQVSEGRQCFVVCPLIEESDKLGATSVQEEYEKLIQIFPDLSIAVLHGKMKSDQKDNVMTRFKEGKSEILVSTTVIEVGVDVPNSSIMLIEGAERFGVAQLHQIRGRVGRGEYQSYCFLFPSESSGFAWQRLDKFVKCKDGFEVAELDLSTRGAGNVFGTQQSGLLAFRFASLEDTKFIEEVNEAAQRFLKEHDLKDFPELYKHVAARNEAVHLE